MLSSTLTTYNQCEDFAFDKKLVVHPERIHTDHEKSIFLEVMRHERAVLDQTILQKIAPMSGVSSRRVLDESNFDALDSDGTYRITHLLILVTRVRLIERGKSRSGLNIRKKH